MLVPTLLRGLLHRPAFTSSSLDRKVLSRCLCLESEPAIPSAYRVASASCTSNAAVSMAVSQIN